MSDIAICIDNLGKQYTIAHARAPYRTLQEDLLALPRRAWATLRGETRETVWVLRDLSLEVRRGEVLGVIGRNGAGKSTLLKILARVTEPSAGRAELRGRVGSLLEVGSGFHPELTGRENIFLSGALLGMTRPEIRACFDEIVAFAGVERFLDTPAKHFSSGMYMRLAFAVAAHLQTEILLLDEVLAVGDAEFQRKCLGVVEGIAGSGRTVLFVSHNLGAIESLCSRAVILDHGRLVADGDASRVVARYLQAPLEQDARPIASRTDRRGDGRVRFTGINVETGDGVVRTGQPVVLRLHFDTREPVSNVAFAIGVTGPGGGYTLFFSTEERRRNLPLLERPGSIACAIGALPLAGGNYGVNLYCAVNGAVADHLLDAATLAVNDAEFYGGGARHTGTPLAVAPHEWTVR